MGIKDGGIFSFRIDLIDGTPIADVMSVIPTPQNLENLATEPKYFATMDALDRRFLIEVMRWGLAYGYKQEQDGAIIQNLFPIKRHEAEQISSSSRVLLEMHTETAFHPYRPEVLALFCIREDPKAGTVYSLLGDILNVLSEQAKEQLRLRNFTTSLDASFRLKSNSNKTISTSILSDDDSTLTFDRDLMVGITKEADLALSDLCNAVEETKKVIYLETGDVLAINNATVVHGRTPFAPRYDGTDRWLKRALIRSTPPPISDVEVSGTKRVIITDF